MEMSGVLIFVLSQKRRRTVTHGLTVPAVSSLYKGTRAFLDKKWKSRGGGGGGSW